MPPKTRYDVLDDAAIGLRDAGVDSPRAEARLLFAHAMGVQQEAIISGATPDNAALARFGAAVERRSEREPFAYIVGRREFFSLDFAVGTGVLIPRPESEMLVEEALRRFPRRDEKLLRSRPWYRQRLSASRFSGRSPRR